MDFKKEMYKECLDLYNDFNKKLLDDLILVQKHIISSFLNTNDVNSLSNEQLNDIQLIHKIPSFEELSTQIGLNYPLIEIPFDLHIKIVYDSNNNTLSKITEIPQPSWFIKKPPIEHIINIEITPNILELFHLNFAIKIQYILNNKLDDIKNNIMQELININPNNPMIKVDRMIKGMHGIGYT